MKTYKMLGGGTISANTNKKLVEQLRDSSQFGGDKGLKLYMEDTAKACQVLNGAVIRTDNYDVFVEDLIKAGFLEEAG